MNAVVKEFKYLTFKLKNCNKKRVILRTNAKVAKLNANFA